MANVKKINLVSEDMEEMDSEVTETTPTETKQKHFDVRILQRVDTLENFLEKDAIYLANELLFASSPNDNMAIYLGDGVSRFSELQPIFSTQWILKTNTVEMYTVRIEANEWEDKKVTKSVTNVTAVEDQQIIIPVWAQASKSIAQSCGVDFIVPQDGKLEFTCNVTPTETLVMFIGIFGRKIEEGDNSRYIRTDIDASLSTESTNPVENRVIATKINSIDTMLRTLMGDEYSDGDGSLADVVKKLDNATTYSEEKTVAIGTYANTDDENETIYRTRIPFTLIVNRANLDPESDLSSFEISHSGNINMTLLSNAYWTGKASTGEFFGSCPIIIGANNKINLLSVPVAEQEYTLKGNVTIEYVL